VPPAASAAVGGSEMIQLLTQQAKLQVEVLMKEDCMHACGHLGFGDYFY
jgi:hypothetical protein